MAEQSSPSPWTLRLTIPPRLYMIPGSAFALGTMLGMVRGSREASMRFLAENAHHPPRTVRGWYLYNKTKNYRVMWAGMRGAGKDGVRLALGGAAWAGIEEGVARMGGVWQEGREVVAGVGTAGGCVIVYGLRRQLAMRAIGLGFGVGITACALRWARDWMKPPLEVLADNI